MTLILQILGTWLLVAIVVGLLLGRQFKSTNSPARRRARSHSDDHVRTRPGWRRAA